VSSVTRSFNGVADEETTGDVGGSTDRVKMGHDHFRLPGKV
jgi:hypothetical protein